MKLTEEQKKDKINLVLQTPEGISAFLKAAKFEEVCSEEGARLLLKDIQIEVDNGYIFPKQIAEKVDFLYEKWSIEEDSLEDESETK